eukprot:TRINITY_DN14046_c0_g1_i1.p1 TRINITY_DN14046_c0_g1~~TRINITY_DN14046_c0_g1_i1.p1  ORF type:complete len:173 (+),score=37.06 TRINITY_DN14046_c0_g1_i1:313-831(+)
MTNHRPTVKTPAEQLESYRSAYNKILQNPGAGETKTQNPKEGSNTNEMDVLKRKYKESCLANADLRDELAEVSSELSTIQRVKRMLEEEIADMDRMIKDSAQKIQLMQKRLEEQDMIIAQMKEQHHTPGSNTEIESIAESKLRELLTAGFIDEEEYSTRLQELHKQSTTRKS